MNSKQFLVGQSPPTAHHGLTFHSYLSLINTVWVKWCHYSLSLGCILPAFWQKLRGFLSCTDGPKVAVSLLAMVNHQTTTTKIRH